MEVIELEKTELELFEYQPNHYEKEFSNHCIVQAMLLNSAIDFKSEGMAIGLKFPVEGDDGPEDQPFHVICDGQGFRAEFTKQVLFLGNQKYLLDNSVSLPLVEDHWNLEKIADFMANPTYPMAIFDTITSTIKKYCELENDAQYGLIAAWVMATYFAHLFPAFPFLLFIGHKETGKSKVLEIINHLAFNSVKVKTITEAALCQITDGLRGTILIDQAEALPTNIVGILADSYKKEGAKRLIIGHKNGRRGILEYSGYGPKAFATTKTLDLDLNDRCCEILTQRSLQPLPDIFGFEPEWAAIRDACYRFLLLKWQDVQAAYMRLPFAGSRNLSFMHLLHYVYN